MESYDHSKEKRHDGHIENDDAAQCSSQSLEHPVNVLENAEGLDELHREELDTKTIDESDEKLATRYGVVVHVRLCKDIVTDVCSHSCKQY